MTTCILLIFLYGLMITDCNVFYLSQNMAHSRLNLGTGCTFCTRCFHTLFCKRTKKASNVPSTMKGFSIGRSTTDP
ncbi:hypothetical protein PF008_g14470 [Phytophthora fragariae]|uniref:Secreted protein n=1 Tax=Phytophthora fragariae TaxID=53985 RepID=A0A6G0RH10_9STRA|nr:hypothetical protein PF008_g14470 [Phytophthora fragariae]